MPGIPVALFADGEVEVSVVCAVCRCVAIDAVCLADACECRFCESCVRPALTKCATACPACAFDAAAIAAGPGEVRAPDAPPPAFEIVPLSAVDERVQTLRVRCVNAKQGCPSCPKLAALDAHLAECVYRAVACSQCLEPVCEADLVAHQKSACPERRQPCEHCQEIIAGVRAMQAHVGVCPAVLLPCPNGCTLDNGDADSTSAVPLRLSRAALREHLDGACARAVSACMHARFGCAFVGTASQLAAHEEGE